MVVSNLILVESFLDAITDPRISPREIFKLMQLRAATALALHLQKVGSFWDGMKIWIIVGWIH